VKLPFISACAVLLVPTSFTVAKPIALPCSSFTCPVIERGWANASTLSNSIDSSSVIFLIELVILNLKALISISASHLEKKAIIRDQLFVKIAAPSYKFFDINFFILKLFVDIKFKNYT
jgi:hypothetical protein